jgi:hypothetical protein
MKKTDMKNECTILHAEMKELKWCFAFPVTSEYIVTHVNDDFGY